MPLCGEPTDGVRTFDPRDLGALCRAGLLHLVSLLDTRPLRHQGKRRAPIIRPGVVRKGGRAAIPFRARGAAARAGPDPVGPGRAGRQITYVIDTEIGYYVKP